MLRQNPDAGPPYLIVTTTGVPGCDDVVMLLWRATELTETITVLLGYLTKTSMLSQCQVYRPVEFGSAPLVSKCLSGL